MVNSVPKRKKADDIMRWRRFQWLQTLCFQRGDSKTCHQYWKTIRITHYPSYCSKYNPIEYRVFPYITKALYGIVLDKVETVKELVETRAKTKTGLKVFSNIIDKVYLTGKKATDSFLEKMPILFDTFLPKWNYKAVPEY